MTMRMIAVVAAAVLSAVAAPLAQKTPPDPQLAAATDAYARAKETYEGTMYETAALLLDEWVKKFATPPIPEERREVVIRAFELRARSRHNVGRLDEARQDFRQILLYIDPAYHLSAEVTQAAVRNLFDEVRRNAIGTIDLSVTPADAIVTINGKRVPSQAAAMSLPGNTYSLVAVRPGYQRAEQSFTVQPGGTTQPLSVTLDRVSSNVAFVTSPAGVEVLVDGDSRGRTELDPAAGASVSKPFLVAELPNGRRKFEFRFECYRSAEQTLDITRPDDYPPVTVKLEPAMGSIRVSATNAPGAQVIRNGVPQGTLPAQAGTPLPLDRLCEGSHTIEVQSPSGRDVRRYPDLRAGQVETFVATLRPAFAIVSDSGLAAGVRGGQDFRRATENDFTGAASLLLFAPDEARTAEFSKTHDLPPDWLKFNALGDRLGGATRFGDVGTKELVTKLSDTLNAQGVASVTRRDPGGDQAEMLLILLARGSAFPDIIPWRLGDRLRARDVMAEFDKAPPLLRSSIGITPVDVLDVQGAVVAAVESGGRAEEAGIRAGEIISAAGGALVKSAAQLLDLVASHQSGALSLDVRAPTGVARKVDVTVVKVPSLISLEDESLWSNRLAVGYTALAAERTQLLDQIAARLNLAVVLLRLKNYAEAATELDRVAKSAEEGKIPPSMLDVVVGTAQYLIGICAEAQRDFPRAEQAWKRAAQARGNLLTENGEPLKELATRRLDQLASGR